MSELFRRLRSLLRRRQLDRDLEEEIRFHVETQAEENRQNGMEPVEARYAARRQFGNVTLLKERSREMWGVGAVEQLLQDLKYSTRLLRRSPGFTVAVVLSLALGIGVNTAIFSVVDGLLFRPLPVPQSDRLVSLQHRAPSSSLYNSMSFPDYAHYRDHNTVFSGLAAHEPVQVSVLDGDRSLKLDGEIVSGNYFAVLGIQPALGRWFYPDEDRIPGASPVVVLGYGYWQRWFGGDPGVLGKRITVNRHEFSIIGVAPRGFTGLPAGSGAPRAEFWAPVSMFREIIPQLGDFDLLHYWGNHWILVSGRLKPEVSIAQAEAALGTASDQLREQWSKVWGSMKSWGDNPSRWKAALVPAAEARVAQQVRRSVTTFVWMLAGTVALVLLMACFNVAGLELTRALKRQREIAVQLSLGADRGRVVRQLLVESLLLATAGGAAGVLIARWTAAFLASFRAPFRVPLAVESELDSRVLAFAVGLSILCAVLSGLVPARRASACDLASAMKVDSAGLLAGRQQSRLRGAIVGAQVALSIVFLAGAGLFLRTLANARAADVTVDPGHVLLTQLNPRERGYDEARGQRFYSGLLDRLHAIPGVKSAALVLVVPLGGRRGGTNIKTADGEVQVDFNTVSPRYFETVGIPVLRGRGFTDQDRASSPPVVVINERFARRFFPGEDPVGKWVKLTWAATPQAEVIGIVRDGQFMSVRQPVKPCFYRPLAQMYWGNMALEVRTAGEPAAFVTAVRREIQALDKDFPIGEVLTLRSHREAGLAQERLLASMLAGFAALGVALAAIGIYGVVSFAVGQRTREIGLRMALGANAASVLRLVLGGSLIFVSAGLAAGLAAALLLARFVSSMLFGVSTSDPLTFGGISLLLTMVALLAAWIPARRATKIDPMEALRYE